MNQELSKKVCEQFAAMTIYKDPTTTGSLFAGRNLPSFVKDFLLKRYINSDGTIQRERLTTFLDSVIPTNQASVKDRLDCGEELTLLARFIVEIDLIKGVRRFGIPDVGIKTREGQIPEYVYKNHMGELVEGEKWGIIKLALLPDDDGKKNHVTEYIGLACTFGGKFNYIETRLNKYKQSSEKFNFFSLRCKAVCKRPVNYRYFDSLPQHFRESALLDRFHCFIEGWHLPRINKGMIFKGWTINVEYFSEILHELRTQNIYGIVFDQIVKYDKNADTRDFNAVKRITVGYMKLLFPHWTSVDKVDLDEFDRSADSRKCWGRESKYL